MKNIKDYLHLYLGCECSIIGIPCVLFSISEFVAELKEDSGNKIEVSHAQFDEIKLWLRPLSDMTEKELRTCVNMIYDFPDDPDFKKHKWKDFVETELFVEQFHYLLKQSFDLFGLIKSGLAIDKTKDLK